MQEKGITPALVCVPPLLITIPLPLMLFYYCLRCRNHVKVACGMPDIREPTEYISQVLSALDAVQTISEASGKGDESAREMDSSLLPPASYSCCHHSHSFRS